MVVVALAAAAGALFSCGEPYDGGCRENCVAVPDAGTTPADAGSDAGEDAGAPEEDAGVDDAGVIEDAGIEDAGVPEEDAGFDAGMTDAGCTTDAGAGNPPNLLDNAGFECGSALDGWNTNLGTTLTTETSDPHAGLQAAKITSTSGGTVMSLFPFATPVSQAGAGHFCTSAWVKGPAGVTARISLQVTSGSGGFNDYSFSAPLTGAWQRLATDHATTAFDDKVTMRVWMPNPAAGATMLVDDADLFRTTDVVCPLR